MPGPDAAALRPVPEQERAVELFLAGGNLRIDAYAGTGKTTTLRLLAAGKPGRGLYLAFNRAIAARGPEPISCLREMRDHALGRVPGCAPDPRLPGVEAHRRAYP